MKNLFLMSMASAGMIFTACSNDETVEVAQNQNAIGFSTFVNNSARATDATTDNLENFKVWGLMNKGDQTGTPFEGVTVTKQTDKSWSYGTTPVYWERGYTYSFVALAPEDAYTFTKPTTVGTWGSLTFRNNNGETDLIYAANNFGLANWEGNQCPAAVSLNFNHMLSRVKFQFTNGMDDGSTIKVTNVEIANASTNGMATLAENFANLTWTAEGSAVLAFGNAGTAAFAQNAKEATEHKYMIPTKEKAYTVNFKVERTHNGVTNTYEHQVTIPAMEIGAGKSYQFCTTLDATNINPDEELCQIVFTATVTDWEDFTNSNTQFPASEPTTTE